MKIKETFVTFSGLVDVGRISYVIDVSNDGLEMSIDELAKQVVHFPRVTLIGEPLQQKDEIYKLVNKVRKDKPDIVFEIHTVGDIKPLSSGKLGNIIYMLNLRLKNSDVSYDKRIIPSILSWFVDAESNIIFEVNNKDDFDEINLLVSEFGLKKKQIFLMPQAEKYFHMVFRAAKYLGYNFAPKFNDMLWPDDGRHFK